LTKHTIGYIIDALNIHIQEEDMPRKLVDPENPESVKKFILKLVGKVPSKVTLTGHGDGMSHEIPLGTVKTKITGVWIDGDKVMVSFKKKVWGSTRHEAFFYKGKVYFPIPRKPGTGLSPEFAMTK